MLKTKFLAGVLLIAAILFSQTGTVLAAPAAQDSSSVTGSVTGLECNIDSTGNTTIVVTLLAIDGTTQTATLDANTAEGLGLVTLDSIGNPDCSAEALQTVVDSSLEVTVTPTTEETTEPDVHIISKWLADFFFDGDPEMAVLIDSFHNGENEQEQVYGFGNIAQALWIAKGISNIEDGTVDPETVGLILQGKTEKDFTAFFDAHPEYLAEGESAPTNWGQFKKLVSEKKDNLGSVVSGKAEKDKVEDDTTVEQAQPGNGKDKNNDKSNNGKGKDKSKDKDKGKN